MRIVVDIGNSRMKWGRCAADGVTQIASLPLYELDAYQKQLDEWRDASTRQWVLAASNPLALERFSAWLEVNDEAFLVLKEHGEFPLPLAVERPEQVGKDRLANALAYRALRWLKTKKPGILVDAGSALTIDLVDAEGVFRGGAILPGLSMMARALNYYTTRLPLVDLPANVPTQPGRSTQEAIQLGICSAALGAIHELRRVYGQGAHLVLTGGDAMWVKQACPEAEVWPEMTLEGIRLAAEALS
jgi:type III pantothenate kinase